jgi:type IV secretory pathway VirB10-like protein
MGLVKSVGDKLDSSIKSGEIKESELMTEATEIMNKMKNMPGLGDISSILNKMGLNKMGGKFNMGAMESQLKKNTNMAKMKERCRAKAEMNRKMKEQQQQQLPRQFEQSNSSNTEQLSEEQLTSIFSTGEKVEKTPRKPTNKKRKAKK